MKTSWIPAVAFGAACVFTGPGTASGATPSKTAPDVPSLTQNSESNRTPPTLEAGMTAEEVQRAIGKPIEIKPIVTPEGKAETWIYRRQIGKNTTLDSIPTSFSSGALPDSLLGTSGPVEYRTKTTLVYQVTSLLMFQGKLVKAKQSVSQVMSFDR